MRVQLAAPMRRRRVVHAVDSSFRLTAKRLVRRVTLGEPLTRCVADAEAPLGRFRKCSAYLAWIASLNIWVNAIDHIPPTLPRRGHATLTPLRGSVAHQCRR